MELKKVTISKCFYNSRETVDFFLPKGLAFARAYPRIGHYDGQVDMISIFECSEEDEEKLDSANRWLSIHRLDKYVIVTMKSVDDTNEIPVCSIEELNDKYDLSEYFIVELDADYKFIYIAKIKGIVNSENLLVDLVDIYGEPYSIKLLKKIHFNTELPIDRLGESYSDHYSNRLLKTEKAKKIYYTSISRYLNETGIDWQNEYVDENLDIDYVHRLAQEGVEQIGVLTNTKTGDFIESFSRLSKNIELINNWFDE